MTLFDNLPEPDVPLSRATDPPTSHAAEVKFRRSGSLASHEGRILAVLASSPGLTSDEIAVAAGMDRVAAARRMRGLERKGEVCRGEARASAVSGNPGVTWRRRTRTEER